MRTVRATIVFSVLLAVASVARAGSAGAPTFVVTVTDAAGEAVPGARVSLWRAQEAGPLAIATSPCDDEGRAAFDARDESGLFLVSAVAPGFVRRVVETESLSGSLELALEHGRTIELTVLDQDSREPVRALRWLALPAVAANRGPGFLPFLLDGLEARDLVSRDGRYLLTGLPDEPVQVAVDAEGYALASVSVRAPGTTPVTIALDARGCHDVFVVDAATGSPLSEVALAASARLLESTLARLGLARTTNAAGRARFCVPAGAVPRIAAASPGYAPAFLDLAGEEPLAEPIEIRLHRGATVLGTVLDANGVPAPHARVTIDAMGFVRETVSDRAGGFRIDQIAPGEVRVRAFSASGATMLDRSLVVADGETHTLSLGGTAPLRIVVAEEADAPLRGARVAWLERGLQESAQVRAEAQTDAKGVASFGGIEPQERGLIAIAEGNALVAVDSQPDADGPSDAPRGIDLPAAMLRGKVVREGDLAPLAGALILCEPRPARLDRDDGRGALRLPALGARLIPGEPCSLAVSDREGRFALRLVDGCRALHVEGPRDEDALRGYRARRVEVPPPGDRGTLRIELAPLPRIAVTVTDEGGAPVSGAVVGVRAPGEATDRETVRTVDGTARLAAEGKGPWLVVARVPGFAPAVAGPLHVAVDRETRAALRVISGAFVEIRACNATPRVADPRGIDWSLITDAEPTPEGSYLVGPLPPGDYVIQRRGVDAERVRLRNGGEHLVVE